VDLSGVHLLIFVLLGGVDASVSTPI